MGRTRCLIVFILLALLCLPACKSVLSGQPAIEAVPSPSQSGLAVRVSGSGWQAGSRITVALTTAGASPRDSVPMTTALADASGAFTALFLLPNDSRWQTMSEILVLAYTGDQTAQATSSFRNPQAITPTAEPAVTIHPTATTRAAIYVVGYVESIAVESLTLTIRPVEGLATAVVATADATITYQDTILPLLDLRTGDLIEAKGLLSTPDRLIAEQVRILTRGSSDPTPTTTSTPVLVTWRGEYYTNLTFSGAPALVRSDPVIDFEWQGSGPAEAFPSDGFSVRWTGTWPFEEGNYRFYAQVDDGVRLVLDDHWIIDRWHESTGALHTADAYLSRNSHLIRVEYFEARESAQAKVWWEYRDPDAKQNYPDWKGEYYANVSLGGLPFVVVSDRVISFDWRDGAPVAGMPSDNFSVRWTRSINLEEGIYIFETRADDGIRLWVDDGLLIDQWQDSAVQTYTAERFISRGSHRLRIEYYESAGQAVISTSWRLLPTTPTPTPTPPPPTATATPSVTPTLVPTAPLQLSPTPEMEGAGATSTFFTCFPLVCGLPIGQTPVRPPIGSRRGGPTED